MAKITVKDTTIKTIKTEGFDYICITDIAKQKNPFEPKDVVKLNAIKKHIGIFRLMGTFEQS